MGMRMSTHVKGIKPADEKYQKMLAIYEQCEDAGVSIPKEVDAFFEHEKPDPIGVVVDITDRKRYPGVVETYSEHDAAQGFQIHLDRVPKDIKIIRFQNSW